MKPHALRILSSAAFAGTIIGLLAFLAEEGSQDFLSHGLVRLASVELAQQLLMWTFFGLFGGASAVFVGFLIDLLPVRLEASDGNRFLAAAFPAGTTVLALEMAFRFAPPGDRRSLVGILSTAVLLLVGLIVGWLRSGGTPSPRATRFTGFVPFIAVAFGVAVLSVDRAFTPDGPNVVWIYLDTLRADHMSAYGYDRATSPHAERLAAKGVLFEGVVAPASATYPSVPATLTSKKSSSVFDMRHAVLAERHATVVEVLRNSGYHTVGFSSSPVVSAERTAYSIGGFDQGFDRFDDSIARGNPINWQWRSPEGVIGAALDWLASGPRRPFFLFLYVMDPHDAYRPPAPWHEQYAAEYEGKEPIRDGNPTFYEPALLAGADPGLSSEDLRHLVALYDAEIRYADEWVGKLLDRLEELDDILVVLTSDHGEEFLEHGGMKHGYTLYDEAIRVPLILSYPGRIPEGLEISGALVHSLDIAPTVLDLAGIGIPDGFEGESLAPLFDPSPSWPRTAVLTETPYSDSKAIVTKRWKYIHHFGLAPLRSNLAERYVRGFELYDLASDPEEERNVAEEHPDVVARLERQLFDMLPAKERLRLGEGERVELDRQSREALESVGYLH